jgi:Phosphodiester glycosidase
VAVNGSYYAVDGSPDTPILTQGRPAGPSRYTAGHGAFVETGDGASVRDLSGTSWQAAFTGASDALVSYPMLIGADGRSRATHGDPALVANRSFVAADRAGRIVLGTTIDAFFTLDRLADFLRASPLDLRLALNLDGGPVACQAVRTTVGAAERDFCGRWETARHDGHVDVLGSLFGSRRAALPLVLVALPR